MVGAHIILSLNFKIYMFFSACSLRSDFRTTFRLCPMNGGGSFHCIPDVDDDCISDSQVKTHGALLFSTTLQAPHFTILQWNVFLASNSKLSCPFCGKCA